MKAQNYCPTTMFNSTLTTRIFLHVILTSIVALNACSASELDRATPTHLAMRSETIAAYASGGVQVDGVADEEAWSRAKWRAIDARWLGPEYTATDFSGRFKVLWDEHKIYLLVEIQDDILFDSHRDPLAQYWDDDCLEVFLDEDFSGGDHQFNHNAFAYHMSLDNRAIDIGSDQKPRDYSEHVDSHWRQTADGLVWELAVSVYNDQYQDDNRATHQTEALYAGKILGLLLAYCDNDGSELRENFIGSEVIQSGATDRAWIDAGVFGKLILGSKEN